MAHGLSLPRGHVGSAAHPVYHDTPIEEKLATFEARPALGLRRKFHGDPEHLKILAHSEPAADSGRGGASSSIHDTVPGGTKFPSKTWRVPTR